MDDQFLGVFDELMGTTNLTGDANVTWVKALHGPIPEGGFLQPNGALNREQRRRQFKLYVGRSGRMAVKRFRDRPRWAPTKASS